MLENIVYNNICYNILENSQYIFDYDFKNITVFMVLKLSKNLFSGLKYLHNLDYSMDGKLEISNIIFFVRL